MQDLEERQRLEESGVQMKVMLFLPLYHVYGMVAVNLLSLLGGMQLVTAAKFEPKSYLSTIEKYKVQIHCAYVDVYCKNAHVCLIDAIFFLSSFS